MSLDDIRALPKIALHDHLDGGLRPSTVAELTNANPIAAPAPPAEQVAQWFWDTANSGSLPGYLRAFERTLALMQTRENLRRIAAEFVEDMARDGVIYAETRWAPRQHTQGGLTSAEAVDAVQSGLDMGMAAARRSGQVILVHQILADLRHLEPTREVAQLVVAHQGRGVVGYDLAGPELGHPATRLRDQCRYVTEHGSHVTIHAGEAAGIESIRQALECGAERLGHGVRLVDDIDNGVLGPVAQHVRREGITLEVCPTSNQQTGVCDTFEDHPFAQLWALGLPLTVSCDNRLMSRTSLSQELLAVQHGMGWSLANLYPLQRQAVEAAFCTPEEKAQLRVQCDRGWSHVLATEQPLPGKQG